MLDPDVRRQLREVAQREMDECGPQAVVDWCAGECLSLLDALDEADRKLTAADAIHRDLLSHAAGLAEALAVAREALFDGPGHRDWLQRREDALARIDTLTASQGEPTDG